MKKIISYNVNGIRAALKKGLMGWIKVVNPDIICLQEIKANQDQIPLFDFEEAGFTNYWFSAKKKGYSGVAILTREEPDQVIYGMDMPVYDDEGRLLRADYGDTTLISVYHPSGSSGDIRQDFKMQWLKDFQEYVDDLKKTRPNLIISGDYNICHKPIDIHDPIGNKKSSGFLPEEREWLSAFIDSGFVDTFRTFDEGPHNYTWWSYRTKARDRNLGWRIDYHMVTESLKNNLHRSVILADAKHSDHCPIMLEIDI